MDQVMITEQTQLEDLVVLDQEVEVDLLEQLVKDVNAGGGSHQSGGQASGGGGGGAGTDVSLISLDHLLVVQMVEDWTSTTKLL